MASDSSLAFVSYSREDSEFVIRLVKDLKAQGANVWMDQLDIRPGQRWEQVVETALNGCERMLVILSPTSVGSRNVLAEAAFAIDEGKDVIPVLYRECKIPFRLRPFQYADFRTSYEEGLESLLTTLRSERGTDETPATAKTAASLAEGASKQNEKKESAGPRDKPKPTRPIVRYFAIVCGILVLIVVAGFAYQWFKHTNVTSLHSDVQSEPGRAQDGIPSSNIAHDSSLQASQSQRPAESAKLPATRVSKRKTESQRHDKPLTPFSVMPTRNEAQPNKSNTPADSTSSSQAGGSFNVIQHASQSQPDTKSNPSADADAKINTVQEAFRNKEWETVVSLSRELANAGDPRGMYYLGRVYTLGVGVPKSWEQEKYWYEKSAAGGYCYSMYMLGISYNANYDSEHAREWFMKGAAAQPPECAAMCAKRLQRP